MKKVVCIYSVKGFFVSSFGHNALGANVLTKLYTLHLSWYGEIPGQHLD